MMDTRGNNRFTCLVMTMLLFFLPWVAACTQEGASVPAPPSTKPAEPVYDNTIVAVGDSLTEGYGLAESDAYPAQLQRRLNAMGRKIRVVNAGISGETSAGTLSRIDWILTLSPDIVILETGANDGLRGIDPEVTEKNIDEIVRILKENDVTVVLAGMKMVTNLGRPYTESFGAIYPNIAEKHGILFMPFFLEGVAADPMLNQADGIHPTGEGYAIIVENLLPVVLEAIEQVRQGSP